MKLKKTIKTISQYVEDNSSHLDVQRVNDVVRVKDPSKRKQGLYRKLSTLFINEARKELDYCQLYNGTIVVEYTDYSLNLILNTQGKTKSFKWELDDV